MIAHAYRNINFIMSETRLIEEQKQQSLKDKEEKKRLKKVMFENEEKARKELEAKGKLFLEKSPKLTN